MRGQARRFERGLFSTTPKKCVHSTVNVAGLLCVISAILGIFGYAILSSRYLLKRILSKMGILSQRLFVDQNVH